MLGRSLMMKGSGAAIVGDPFFSSVSLLLRGNGANGSTTILDTSPRPKSVTLFGNVQISTSQSIYGGSSILFDGTGDYLTVPSNVELAFGLGNFTVECWCYKQSNSRQMILAIGSSSLFIAINASGNIEIGRSLTAIDHVFTASITSNTWNFVSVQRNGTSLQVAVGGVPVGTVTNTTNWGQGILYIGIDANASTTPFNGYIQDMRITKGVARPPTMPTAPFPDF